MSYIAVNWSYTSRRVLGAGLLSSDLAVLRALCWFYNDSGKAKNGKNCYPGVSRLMKITGFKRGAVNGAKKRLAEKGLIAWVRTMHATNSYQINCPPLLRKAGLAQPMTAFGFGAQNGAPPSDARPEARTLRDEIGRPLSDEAYDWLADALSLVGDIPENRETLLEAFDAHGGDLAFCRQALGRVRDAVSKGRKISNRMAYLRRALNG